MKTLKMTHNHDSMITALLSVAAYALADLSQLLADESFLKIVSTVSAMILLFTALIKFAQLCIETGIKLRKWWKQRFKKSPPTS